MNILDFYSTAQKRDELKRILEVAAQNHPDGLPDFFFEKDLWVTEILRLLYDENFLGEYAVAFKGGTALSKCWGIIDRFSEDIDLSIHWADLAEVDDESVAWEQSTKSRSQRDKFRSQQSQRLTEWSSQLVEKLNQRFESYNIEGLGAELVVDSHGEEVNIYFPKVAEGEGVYHLEHVLLEFGGRNRGLPTKEHEIKCYMADVEALGALNFPHATVQAYEPSYILWEKLTALHQFSTMDKEPDTYRLARHWYDVDRILQKGMVDFQNTKQAMIDVVEMKKQRWAEKGVDYEAALRGEIKLIPSAERLSGIASDHEAAVDGRMFYIHRQPDSFEKIINRIYLAQGKINKDIMAWARDSFR
ncbi:nucleotidyl transferase AbiEii/AbiGii toxin family protein [Cellvibrio sp. KY-GH-1]|uniref:nucleotidyl transferase AbiEii/AbiGii toxin family protein n=1 Tax=Cellvibrio sp. KY-GH-1 TaxID=2303332 RepID=UPI0017869F74|nr:nucleotidyl transferase AbiEii/AbiGii toxin family protein [Cellvibrio sp. KY-GH-1]